MGKLVPAEDIDALSRAIKEYVGCKQKLTCICLKTAKDYDFEHMAECHMIAINSLR